MKLNFRELETVHYQGIDIPVDHRFVIHGSRWFLIPLDSPPVSNPPLNVIEIWGGNMIRISEKDADYTLQINGKWYIPSEGGGCSSYCHINLLRAVYSKLGKSL